MSKAADNEAFAFAAQKWLGVTEDGHAGLQTMAAFLAKVGNGFAPQTTQHKLANPEAFFAEVRLDYGPLNVPQVEGFNALLKAMSAWPVSWVAYGLATAWHETAATMQPIKEFGGAAYFHKMYDPKGQNPKLAARLGNRLAGDGAKYAGRGYVQLTGRANYAKYGIADTPDDAMKLDVAARILVDGMSKGVFTGKKLADYLPGDYANARRIINGVDRAAHIANLAVGFEGALTQGGWA